VQRDPWWKRYLTQLQIGQFIIDIAAGCYMLYYQESAIRNNTGAPLVSAQSPLQHLPPAHCCLTLPCDSATATLARHGWRWVCSPR
jgi:hypothetical protein